MRCLLVFLFFSQYLLAQQFLTKTGEVSFFSSAPLEDIEAVNNKLGAVIDLNTGNYAFKIAIQDFVFPNSLMQEHFNESYLESEKYPYAVFQGEIVNLSSINYQNKNKVVCKGDFTIHGVTNNVEIESDIQMVDGMLFIESNFNVLLKDYKIKIPKVVLYNIAEEINVSVLASLKEN
jgi:polyisoprenoid-binding protein YceI